MLVVHEGFFISTLFNFKIVSANSKSSCAVRRLSVFNLYKSK